MSCSKGRFRRKAGSEQSTHDSGIGHIPAIYQATVFAEAGGLMAWAPDLQDQFRVAARYVDQILIGASQGELPITHPPRYYLTIHAGAAMQLGLVLPPAILVQADSILM